MNDKQHNGEIKENKLIPNNRGFIKQAMVFYRRIPFKMKTCLKRISNDMGRYS